MATPIKTNNLGELKITQVDGGVINSLFLAENGQVFSAGENGGGKTGLGTTSGLTLVATPIDTSNLGDLKITQASVYWHSLLLAEDGRAFSFGPNSSGATGLATTTGNTLVATPINTSNLGGLKVTQVEAANWHSLVLAEDGRVFSFGSNHGFALLGTTAGDTSVATPIDTSNLGGLKITQISAGSFHNLLLAEDGSVFSFGRNIYGGTGLGATTGNTLVATPIDTSNLGSLKITQVSAGSFYSLLLAENGSVFSFGNNQFGKTGLGTTEGETLVATPIDASFLGGLKITQVSAGDDHSLLLAEDGQVFSFGKDGIALGRTGDGTLAMPIDATNLNRMRVTNVSEGASYSLLVAEVTSPPGDYNGNGVVDAADYVVWRATFGQLVPPGSGADGNGNGEVTQLDYVFWKERFGNTVSSGSVGAPPFVAAVPEPVSLISMILAAIGWPYRKSR